jgi:hypothetical protein
VSGAHSIKKLGGHSVSFLLEETERVLMNIEIPLGFNLDNPPRGDPASRVHRIEEEVNMQLPRSYKPRCAAMTAATASSGPLRAASAAERRPPR